MVGGLFHYDPAVQHTAMSSDHPLTQELARNVTQIFNDEWETSSKLIGPERARWPLGRQVMPLMEWSPRLSVGVELLDKDHQKLVKLINDLYDAMKEGHGKESLGSILDRLVDYTKIHFAHEEQYFAQSKYPHLADHKKEHDALTRQALDIQTQYKSGASGVLSLEVMNFLKDWLMNHIQGSDKKYGPYLNSHGIH